MKKAVCIGCAVLIFAGSAFGGMFSEDPGELSGLGLLWLPGEGDSDLFDLGFGAGVSYREWIRFPWGVGLNMGFGQWQVDGGSSAYKWEGLSRYRGDASLLFIGPAMYFSIIDWDNWNLSFETGVQFVYIDSNVKVSLEEETFAVDIDNAILWHLGLEYEYMLDENIYVVAAAGYQIDLMDADTEYSLGDLRSTRLHGTFMRLGAKLLF